MTQIHGEMAAAAAKKGAQGVMGGMAAAGAAAAAQSGGRGLLHRLGSHPFLMLGIGFAAGYFIHKYRKEIIDSATRVTEKGKDFMLQQRENLEDVLAESREAE